MGRRFVACPHGCGRSFHCIHIASHARRCQLAPTLGAEGAAVAPEAAPPQRAEGAPSLAPEVESVAGSRYVLCPHGCGRRIHRAYFTNHLRHCAAAHKATCKGACTWCTGKGSVAAVVAFFRARPNATAEEAVRATRLEGRVIRRAREDAALVGCLGAEALARALAKLKAAQPAKPPAEKKRAPPRRFVLGSMWAG